MYFFGRIVSLAMANAAVVGVFTQIPILSEYAFWILVGAYFIWLAVHRRAKDRFKPLLILSILLILVAVVAVFVEIPIVSDYAFWVMAGAYLVWAGVHYNPLPTDKHIDWGLISSLTIFIVAIIGVFAEIPIVSEYAFWVMTGAYLVLIGFTGGLRKETNSAIRWRLFSLAPLLVDSNGGPLKIRAHRCSC